MVRAPPGVPPEHHTHTIFKVLHFVKLCLANVCTLAESRVGRNHISIFIPQIPTLTHTAVFNCSPKPSELFKLSDLWCIFSRFKSLEPNVILTPMYTSMNGAERQNVTEVPVW